MLEMSERQHREWPRLRCLIPISLHSTRCLWCQLAQKIGGETEKFRVGFPILTDKYLEMLGKHILDHELRCEKARCLILSFV